MLTIESLCVSYGRVQVLRGVNLTVAPGEIVALFGPNGCGKSTTVRAVAGLVRTSSGTIRVGDRQIEGDSVLRRVRAGVTLVDQGRTLFNSMSVEENILMGAFSRKDNEIKDDVRRWLDFFPALRDKRHHRAGSLSGGQQRMVAVARGLMARPELILLDEPSLGVAPNMLLQLGDVIARLRQEYGLAVLLVEQDIPFALDLVDRATVLANGRVSLDGTPDELREGTRLRDVYFGHTPAGL